MSDSATDIGLCCEHDERRELVRATRGRVGLDFVELSDDALVLRATFLGALPNEVREYHPGIEHHLRVEGGDRIRDIAVVDVEPVLGDGDEADDVLLVRVDREGDFSAYALALVDIGGVDPAFDRAQFVFHVDCPRDLDCRPVCDCVDVAPAQPDLDYLARDYASLRRLILDRLALLLPQWTERHVPDVGIALVELLAYVGDYLSYHQDAVATEAYLDTARQRISVRRHARLVDYAMHEGCNARTWVCIETTEDELSLDADAVSLVTGLDGTRAPARTVLEWTDLADVPSQDFDVFEPLVADRDAPIRLYQAHNELHFYTWGDRSCCVGRGSTSATLIDAWVRLAPPPPPPPSPGGSGSRPGYGHGAPEAGDGPPQDESYGEAAQPEFGRALRLAPGDVLIFEEVIGPATALPADAAPGHRHAVRLTAVTPDEDVLVVGEDGRPTPLVRIEWCDEDALPFTLCLSVMGPAPDCRLVENVSVAHGNVLLVDHGRTRDAVTLGPVPAQRTDLSCECFDEPADVEVVAGRFRPSLDGTPLTVCEPLADDGSDRAASALLLQDVRSTLPAVALAADDGAWEPRFDLLDSTAVDRHFCVEIDNDGVAWLRFGNGELGAQPAAGALFAARYRVGCGARGNVGADSISRLVLAGGRADGAVVGVRNPLAATGGTDAEAVADVKLYAPRAFRNRLERAIVAADYEQLAERDPHLQRAAARLTWTGSWYEADVAVDPLATDIVGAGLPAEVERGLHRYRRMGHDLRVVAAEYVPLDIELQVCLLAHYEPAHVRAALLQVFGDRLLADGSKGLFHPDELTFGASVYVSRIVAAGQRVAGVQCLKVTRLQRMATAPNHELRDGVLALRRWEIAQVDNNPNRPDRGRLEIKFGGR